LPEGAAFCFMCGARTPQGIDKVTGEIRQTTTGRLPSPDFARLRKALGPNYELGRLIGRGGFAEVFLVHDKRLKRDLALKALRPDLLISDQLLARFRREAETVAALRHPHIVPIYDIGEAEGIAYILMPYIQGESLRALLLREGPRPTREATRILLEAAAALGAAHEAGVIHRDIKPENIMLEGKARRVQLMDFGIAKAIDASDATGLTSTGMLVGTPHYMSPEQASGEPNLDHRSDQYSLSVVGFQMITGSLPFDGESTRAVLFQQMVGVPKNLRDLVPDVPASVAFAIDRALAKDPKDRFPSMEAFTEAITGPDAWPLTATPETATAPSLATAGGGPTVPTQSGTTPSAAAPARPAARRPWLPIAALGGLGIAAAVVALFLSLTESAGGPGTAADSLGTALAAAPSVPPAAPDTTAQLTAPAPPSSLAAPPPRPPPPPSPATRSEGPRPSPTAARGAETRVGRRPTSPAAAPAADSVAALPAGATCAVAFRASRWTEAAALCRAEGESGNAAAAGMMATLHQRARGVERSDSAIAYWFRKAAAAGDAQAALRLGTMYASGTGVLQNDVEATRLLRQAGEAGLPESWALLAERYEQGLGVKRDDKEAATWYRKAADNHDRAAQYNLGQMYLRGRGVNKSDLEAANWLSKAAEQSHPGAEYEIGMMYLRGRGLPKDEVVGMQWLERAAQHGHEEAKKELEKRRRP
jgi:serine/threonine-protein kinase